MFGAGAASTENVKMLLFVHCKTCPIIQSDVCMILATKCQFAHLLIEIMLNSIFVGHRVEHCVYSATR